MQPYIRSDLKKNPSLGRMRHLVIVAVGNRLDLASLTLPIQLKRSRQSLLHCQILPLFPAP